MLPFTTVPPAANASPIPWRDETVPKFVTATAWCSASIPVKAPEISAMVSAVLPFTTFPPPSSATAGSPVAALTMVAKLVSVTFPLAESATLALLPIKAVVSAVLPLTTEPPADSTMPFCGPATVP